MADNLAKPIEPSAFDIVIAGGGMVGASQALAISQSNPQLSIAIVEAVTATSDHQPSYDSRAIAVARGSKVLLDSYGLWPALQDYGEAICDIQVSDRGHIGKSYLSAQQFNLSALGYVLEVRHLGAVLLDKLKSAANIRWFCPDTINHIEQQPDQLKLTLSSKQVIQTKLLLAADGAQSLARQMVKISNTVTDYDQVAVITNISIDQSHQGRAFERFTEFGPIALLPLSDASFSSGGSAEQRFSLVWCVRPDKVDGLMALDETAFLNQLQQAFGHRAGRFIKAGKRFSYPLTLTKADSIVGHRVALIGNSSHTIHPIAGQGFNLGLRDVEVMRQVISQALDNGEDIGSFATLRQFQQHRQQDLDNVITMTDSLVKLFSQSSKTLALARTMGLLTMQLFDCLKQPLVNQATGIKEITK
ncbi:MAG: 2-octaprenyl-6-methoxyphenol hydroxylase [Phenylobacterium sp.]|jgi:2-octaprenyl-6-methoxyphenol hydroxylase